MVARAAEIEPLIGQAWVETTRPVLLPFSRPGVTRQVAAVHAAQQAAGFRRARLVIVVNRPPLGRRPTDGGPSHARPRRAHRPRRHGGHLHRRERHRSPRTGSPSAYARSTGRRSRRGSTRRRGSRPWWRCCALSALTRSSTSIPACSTSRCAATAGHWQRPSGCSCVSSATSRAETGCAVRLEPALLLPDFRRGRRRAHGQRAPCRASWPGTHRAAPVAPRQAPGAPRSRRPHSPGRGAAPIRAGPASAGLLGGAVRSPKAHRHVVGARPPDARGRLPGMGRRAAAPRRAGQRDPRGPLRAHLRDPARRGRRPGSTRPAGTGCPASCSRWRSPACRSSGRWSAAPGRCSAKTSRGRSRLTQPPRRTKRRCGLSSPTRSTRAGGHWLCARGCSATAPVDAFAEKVSALLLTGEGERP